MPRWYCPRFGSRTASTQSWLAGKDAYREALAQVLLEEDVIKTLLQSNEEKYKLLCDGVPVKYRDTSGGLVDRPLKLIDFDDASNNARNWITKTSWLFSICYKKNR